MRAIRNISELLSTLQEESKDWKQIIYDQTGVIVSIINNNWLPYSKCGEIALDSDVEYWYKEDLDCTNAVRLRT